MSSLFKHLTGHLKAQAAINALVGTGTASRMFLDFVKQNAPLPYLRFEIFPGEAAQGLAADANYVNSRVQIDAYATTTEDAYTLAETVKAELTVTRPLMTDGTNNIRTSCVALDSYDFGTDPPEEGSKTYRYWVSRDYDIWASEETV